MQLPNRRRPAHGVFTAERRPTIVFLTVCSHQRRCWLAHEAVQRVLVLVWGDATAWRVGRYVLMPDHLHLFCAVDSGSRNVTLDSWVRYWKSQFSQLHRKPEHRWQSGHWDTRLRTGESYEAKWHYVRDNPVRAGLVEAADDWPYQGEIHLLDWP